MEKQIRVLADVLSGSPLDLPCDKLWKPHGWCEKHCMDNMLQEPDAECWLKYAEEVAKEENR